MAFIRHFTNISKLLLASVLAATLVCPVFSPNAAWADDVSEAQAALDQAEERMAQIQEEYEAIEAQIDDLQVQIDAATEGVMQAQADMQEGRYRLGQMCAQEYKNGEYSLLDVILEAKDLATLLDNLHYLDVMQEAESEEIELQRQREEKFNAALEDMNAKKDAQMDALEKAEAKSAEAEQVVANAASQLEKAEAEAAEAKRLAELQARAAKMAEERAAAAQSAAPAPQEPQKSEDSAETPDDEADKPANEATNPSSGGNSKPEDSNEGTQEPQAGWQTGPASAYGSKSDGTLGASTATGAIVTSSSMGVADRKSVV